MYIAFQGQLNTRQHKQQIFHNSDINLFDWKLNFIKTTIDQVFWWRTKVNFWNIFLNDFK